MWSYDHISLHMALNCNGWIDTRHHLCLLCLKTVNCVFSSLTLWAGHISGGIWIRKNSYSTIYIDFHRNTFSGPWLTHKSKKTPVKHNEKSYIWKQNTKLNLHKYLSNMTRFNSMDTFDWRLALEILSSRFSISSKMCISVCRCSSKSHESLSSGDGADVGVDAIRFDSSVTSSFRTNTNSPFSV